jgi:predicted secreted protein
MTPKPSPKPFVIKILLEGTVKKLEPKAQSLIDSMGEQGYMPILLQHGNSFKDVSVAILFHYLGGKP